MQEQRKNPAVVRQLAQWCHDYSATPIGADTAQRARAILLDSLGCALYASTDEKAKPVLQTLRRLAGNTDCTIIGSRSRASLPLAAFVNGALIRTLDLNDTYTGPKQVGHPSDNIGAALAAAELARRSGRDLIAAIRLGYEIYGRILDLGNPESDWDHVTVSGVVTAAMTGWLLGLPIERLSHALALAAIHSATMGEVRVGQVSGAKAIANAVVVQTASLLTLLAADGVTGPDRAIEGDRGYAKLILDGADFSAFFEDGARDRLLSVGLKQYPCFALGQGPIAAAIELRKMLPQPLALQRLTVSLADTGPARLRLRDDHGRMPASREAADHSIYFLVAVALIDGRYGLDQLAAGRWQDDDVRDVIARMEARIDPSLRPPTSLPCRLEAALPDGRSIVIERPVTPGNAQAPLTWNEVTEKFRRCADGVLTPAAAARVIALVESIDTVPAVGSLLESLVPA
ncbi:MAG: MmgE/PrpD family protein [Hyphomicrobiales bacterium]|nr:MmgE/PrpD family protein [Hyphomicrobiales bacterium]